MVTSLHVRKLDEDIVRRLKRRAAANNRSMEAEHRAILAEVLKPAPEKSFEELSAALRAETADRKHTPSEVLVRMSRDEAR
jgi:plasmid stability protein